MFLNVLCWLSTVMVNHHCSVLSLLIFAFKSFFSNGMWEMFQESCCKHISHIYILPAQRIFRFFFFFCIYIFMLICGSMWVRKCVWMNSTRLEKYMFWCPFGSCCTLQKMRAIITVIVPRFWQPSLHSLFSPKRSVICFPLLMDFLYDSSLSLSLVLSFSLPECVWWACETLKVTVFDC